MLDPNLPHSTPAPKPPLLPLVNAAKWPPDDDDVPGAPMPPGGGGFAPGGYGGGDGDFKKGRFAPVAILVGVLAVA